MDLLQISLSVLDDSKIFLQEINPDLYAQPLEILSEATIGQHARHFIEFYQCLLAQAGGLTINYCLRDRNLDIETDPTIAIQIIDEISSKLKTLDLDIAIVLNTVKDGYITTNSTLGRELYYCAEHCIHHLALIKIGIKIVQPSLILPPHFGVAPSTIKYRELVA